MRYSVEMLWYGDNPASNEPPRWHQETIHNQEIRDGVIVAGFRIVASMEDGFTSIVGQVDVPTLRLGVPPFDVTQAAEPCECGNLAGDCPGLHLPKPNFYEADYPGRVQSASYKPVCVCGDPNCPGGTVFPHDKT